MADAGAAAVTLDSVTLRFGAVTALSEVSTTLDRGVVGLIGPNGAGKTTLLSVITGSRRPDRGTCLVHGIDLGDRRSRRRALRHLGVLPQSFDLAPRMTVYDVVAYAGWCNGLPRAALGPAVDDAIEAVGLGSSRSRRVRTLSGGERQRLGLAAATVHSPSVIVLDEPTVGLDPEQRLQFRSRLTALSSGCLVLLTTHLLEDVAHTADRILVLTRGTVSFDGTVAQLEAEGRAHASDISGSSALERGYLAHVSGTEVR